MSLGKLQIEIQQRKEKVNSLYPLLMQGREKARSMSEGTLEFYDVRLRSAVSYEIFLFEYYLLQLKKFKQGSELETKEIAEEEKAIHEVLTRLYQPKQYKLEDNPANIIQKLSKQANDALVYASKNNDDALFDAALFTGAHPNAETLGDYALIRAAKNQNVRMVEALIDAGADINVCGGLLTRESALICAVGNNDIKMVKLLLNKKANVNQTINRGETALFKACSSDYTSLPILELLLSCPGIHVNQVVYCQVSGYCSPLSEALRNMKRSHDGGKVRCLLRSGAVKKEKDFCFVVTEMGIDAVRLMLDEGYVCTPKVLEHAFRYASSDIIDLLVKQKDAPIEKVKNNLIKYGKFTELMFAVLMGNAIEVARLAKEANSDIDALNDVRYTALMIAVKLGRTELVTILLKAGANIHRKDEYGPTALKVATVFGKEEIAKLLLEYKADVTKSTTHDQGDGLAAIMDEIKPGEQLNRTVGIDLMERKSSVEREVVQEEEAAELAGFIATIGKATPKLDQLFNDLKTKIGQIDNHPFAKAQEEASHLLTSLQRAKQAYEWRVKENPRVFKNASEDFLKSCESAIKIAKPVLERDLGWGTYLQNLLRSIANAFISVAPFFGCQHIFFQKQRATSAMEVEAFHSQLKDNIFNLSR